MNKVTRVKWNTNATKKISIVQRYSPNGIKHLPNITILVKLPMMKEIANKHLIEAIHYTAQVPYISVTK